MHRDPIKVINKGYQWYVLRVQGAYEKKASFVLHFHGSTGAIPHYELVKQLWVPEITVQYFAKSGVKREKRTSMMPGYLFMEAILSHKLYSAFKKPNIPYVFGWLQTPYSWPSVVPRASIQHLATIGAQEPEAPKLAFRVGDIVTLAGLGVRGAVLDISEGHATIEVLIFQRKVPIRISRDHFGEVEKITRGGD